MNFNKIKNFCRKIRILAGLALVITAYILSEPLFLLGILPLIAGLINFCPLCLITKKCTI